MSQPKEKFPPESKWLLRIKGHGEIPVLVSWRYLNAVEFECLDPNIMEQNFDEPKTFLLTEKQLTPDVVRPMTA